MFKKLFEVCHQFQIQAALQQQELQQALMDLAKQQGQEVNPEQAKALMQELSELGQDLKVPDMMDQEDILILLRRAGKALDGKDMAAFNQTMSKLDKLLRHFTPESFEPEFMDFVLDQDTWNWLHELPKKPVLSKHDLVFLSILKDNLKYLAAKKKLIE